MEIHGGYYGNQSRQFPRNCSPGAGVLYGIGRRKAEGKGPRENQLLITKMKKASIEKATDFGEAIAIFAGDLCFPFAIESLNQSGFSPELIIKALHAFSEGFREVIDGVILETGDAILNDGNEETYLKMINFKTGALIRKAVQIGAILGNGNNSQIKALTSYCDGIGMAFQIQDDLLGVFGDPEELGKPVGSDIRENKNTILKIHALTKGSEKDIKRLKELFGKEDIDQKELQEVQKIFTTTGAVDRALKMINEATENAIKALDLAKPPFIETAKNQLISLAKFLVERKK